MPLAFTGWGAAVPAGLAVAGAAIDGYQAIRSLIKRYQDKQNASLIPKDYSKDNMDLAANIAGAVTGGLAGKFIAPAKKAIKLSYMLGKGNNADKLKYATNHAIKPNAGKILIGSGLNSAGDIYTINK